MAKHAHGVLLLVGLLAACGSGHAVEDGTVPLATGQEEEALARVASDTVVPVTLTLTSSPGAESPSDPLSAALVLGDAQTPLGTIPGGLRLPEAPGMLGVATFFAGAGAQLYLVRERDEVRAMRADTTEEDGPGSAEVVGRVTVAARTPILLQAAGPQAGLASGMVCPAADRVFRCELDGEAWRVCRRGDDRLVAVLVGGATLRVVEGPMSAEGTFRMLTEGERRTLLVSTGDDEVAFISDSEHTFVRSSRRTQVSCTGGIAQLASLGAVRPATATPAWLTAPSTPRGRCRELQGERGSIELCIEGRESGRIWFDDRTFAFASSREQSAMGRSDRTYHNESGDVLLTVITFQCEQSAEPVFCDAAMLGPYEGAGEVFATDCPCAFE